MSSVRSLINVKDSSLSHYLRSNEGFNVVEKELKVKLKHVPSTCVTQKITKIENISKIAFSDPVTN